MTFASKLDNLMTCLNINNAILAEYLHIDPSLISRWRSGKRLPAKNSTYIEHICQYCQTIISHDHQKIALLVLMNMPSDMISLNNTDWQKALHDWFLTQNNNSRKELQIAENFLLHTEKIPSKSATMSNYYLNDLKSGQNQVGELFIGAEGMRHATLKILTLSLMSNKANTLYIFSDQNHDWINQHPQYELLWQQLLQQCIAKGDTVKVVHNVMCSPPEQFATIKRWLPLYMTGKVESYYAANHLSNIHCQTLYAIPQITALHSFSYNGNEYQAPIVLYNENKMVDSIQNNLNHIIQNSYPMIQTYTAENSLALQKRHLEFIKTPANSISMINMLTSFTSTEKLFSTILSRQNISDQEKDDVFNQFKLRKSFYSENLISHKYTEIINLAKPGYLDLSDLPFNLNVLLGHNNAYYKDISEFKEHVENVIFMLKNYPNYQCILQDSSLFSNVQIQAKDKCGVFFTKESSILFSFFLSQPTISQVFYQYLQNAVANFSEKYLDRNYTIACLEKYLYL